MSNDIVPNNCTVGDTYYASVMCDGVKNTIAFYVGTRSGATNKMVIETLRHFISAISTIGLGYIDCAEGMHLRTNYGISSHGEARVSIWAKSPGLPVLLEKGMRFIQGNVFTEDCSAQDFIDIVYGHINAMDVVLQSGAVSLQRPQQKPKSELDKHFPRDDNSKPATSTHSTGALPAPKNIVGERPVFDFLPKDKKLEIESSHTGQIVGLQLGAIERELLTYDDGNTEDRIRFWSPSSEYAYSAKIKVTVDAREHNYSLKDFSKSGLLERLPEAGYKIPINGVAYFKLVRGKGDYADKVYWNFNSFVAGQAVAQDAVPKATVSQQGGTAQDEYMGEHHSADEIPF